MAIKSIVPVWNNYSFAETTIIFHLFRDKIRVKLSLYRIFGNTVSYLSHSNLSHRSTGLLRKAIAILGKGTNSLSITWQLFNYDLLNMQPSQWQNNLNSNTSSLNSFQTINFNATFCRVHLVINYLKRQIGQKIAANWMHFISFLNADAMKNIC